MQFASQELVDAFVLGLPDRSLVGLTDCCSACRRNDVATKLRRARAWRLVDAPVNTVLLAQAEPDLADVFHGRHGGRLLGIASDPDVLAHPAYRSRAAGEGVNFPR